MSYEEQLAEVTRILGEAAVEALLAKKARYKIWTCSVPDNHWVEANKSGDYLWHSDTIRQTPVQPNPQLWLFRQTHTGYNGTIVNRLPEPLPYGLHYQRTWLSYWELMSKRQYEKSQPERFATKTLTPPKPMYLSDQPVKPLISLDQAMLCDIRIGHVREAERVPKTKKLIKLTVDFDVEVRTILTNLGELYEVDAFQGKSFPFLLNLPDKTMHGIVSQGMILGTESEQGRPRLLTSDANPGAVVL